VKNDKDPDHMDQFIFARWLDSLPANKEKSASKRLLRLPVRKKRSASKS
jgi:hypothetical protein